MNNNFELFTRKKNARFIEKMFQYLDYTFDHCDFKNLIYNKAYVIEKNQFFIKSVYDAYVYLLSNIKTPFTSRFIKRFYYLLFEKEIDDSICLKLQTEFNKPSETKGIEKCINFFLYVKEIFKNDKYCFIIAYLLLNYSLCYNNLCAIVFMENDFQKIEDYIKQNKYDNKKNIYLFIIDLYMNQKKQTKDYKESLYDFSFTDVYDFIIKNKKNIEEKFSIDSISIYGSFSEGTYRIDSDIDLLVEFKPNISYLKKEEKSMALKYYLESIFNRYVDIHELGKIMQEKIALEMYKAKKIF